MKGWMNGDNWTIETEVPVLRKTGVTVREDRGVNHAPLNQGFIVDMFNKKLSQRIGDDKIIERIGMLSPDEQRYMYYVQVQATADMAFSVGFVNFNDKSASFKGLAGEEVFVCSNQSYTGVVTSRKHVGNPNVWAPQAIDGIFDCFDEFSGKRIIEIDRMKDLNMTKNRLGQFVLDLHTETTFSGARIQKIVNEIQNPTFDYGSGGHSGWDAFNAVTHITKEVKNPIQKIVQEREAQAVIAKMIA